jgi:phage terminase large subunit
VLVLHRRAGKTTAILNHLQRDAIRVPESQYAFVAPTYKQAKRIAWKILKKIAKVTSAVPNEAELTMTYPNGSIIFLAGSENIESLRGIPLWGGGQDESSQQPSNLFSEVISKCLADHLGYWIWGGTPKGKNQFYRTFENAKSNPQAYTVIFKTIDDTLQEESGEVVENLRRALEDDRKLVEIGEMTEDEFQQEWYCSFNASIRGAYYAKQVSALINGNRYKPVPYDEDLPVHTVWDLGIGRNLAIGFYQKSNTELRMIDYWQGTNQEGIAQAAKVLQDKPYLYGKHFGPHDVKTPEITSGKTRIDSAKEFGIEFEVVPKVSVDDGIDKGRRMFPRLVVDSNNCSEWLDAMGQYRQDWDENKGMFIEKPYHDWTSHKADIHRYASLVEDQMINDFVEQEESEYWRKKYNQSQNKGTRFS